MVKSFTTSKREDFLSPVSPLKGIVKLLHKADVALEINDRVMTLTRSCSG